MYTPLLANGQNAIGYEGDMETHTNLWKRFFVVNRLVIVACVVGFFCLGVIGSLRRQVVELASKAEKPWGVDFDIKYVRGEHQWQITNLVLHPPPPAPSAGEEPPRVMTKPTFPFYELEAMNTADADVKKKLAQTDVDPKLQQMIKDGMKLKTSALDSAVGCPEGSEPGSSIKTACPGIGSGKPQEVKRQWNMGFPPQEGDAAQQSSAFKGRGMNGGDVDRGQTNE